MRSSGNKYSRLISNTALFGISTFSSKVLAFLLTRLYTSYMDTASFGLTNIVVISSNLLIPLVSLGISNAVIRYGLEKDISKKGVYSSGLIAIGMGFVVMLLLNPLIGQIKGVGDYIVMLYVYVLISCLRTLNCQFIRAKMQLRLYAIDGILATLFTIGFNVLFLVKLEMGGTGYLLSIICADACSFLFLFLAGKLWRYIRFKRFNWSLFRTMIGYSLPLVPALMFWWVTQSSDQYFILYIVGASASGLYGAATKIPSIVTILSTIFTEAWQLSAVTDGQGRDRDRFFTQVFSAISGLNFVVGGLLILFTRFIMSFLVGAKFFDAWQYVPFLVIASVFSSMVAFQNSVYMVEKKSKLSLVTMMAGAIANLGLNAILIPAFGVNGAGAATALSYVLVFIIRGFNTRRFVRINFQPILIVINTVILVAEASLLILQVPLWPLWCSLLVVLLVIINIASLARAVRQLLHKRSGSQKRIYHAGSGQNEQHK